MIKRRMLRSGYAPSKSVGRRTSETMFRSRPLRLIILLVASGRWRPLSAVFVFDCAIVTAQGNGRYSASYVRKLYHPGSSAEDV